MEKYIGVKQIKARRMNRQEYNDYRGWILPPDEDGTDEGFLVEYQDGGQSNHPDHEGYISWSPEKVFVNAYRRTDDMSFGLAIEAAKLGHRTARPSWNGKDQYVFYVEPRQYALAVPTEAGVVARQPFLAMKTAQDTVVPWLASQSDMLADDWMIVGGE